MNFLKFALAALGLSFFAVGVSASVDNPVNGVEYRTMGSPQPVDSGNKVEVTEFFWYSCPHCNAFDPYLAGWVKAQGNNIVFKRVPVAFRAGDELQQQLYYTIEVLGKTDELHKKIFHAIHVEHLRLNTEASIADFIASQGVDRAKFLAVFDSFGVQSKVHNAVQTIQDYLIDSVPQVAIDGRYVTSPSRAVANPQGMSEPEIFAATLKVMDRLVAKAASERKPVRHPVPRHYKRAPKSAS